jgi:hypothetical protein
LRIVDFVAAVERAYFHPLKSGAFYRTSHIVLLFHGSDAIIASGANVTGVMRKPAPGPTRAYPSLNWSAFAPVM